VLIDVAASHNGNKQSLITICPARVFFEPTSMGGSVIEKTAQGRVFLGGSGWLRPSTAIMAKQMLLAVD
jgi:hypothetical protein